MGGFAVDGAIMIKSADNFYVRVPGGGAFGDFYYGTFTFTQLLEEVHNYTEFTNLFDQYKINAFKITLTPMATGVLTSDAVNAGTERTGYVNATLHWVTDYDDVTAPAASSAGINTLMQYQNYRTRRLVGAKPINIMVRHPAVLKRVFAGVTDGYQVARRPGWLDVAQTDHVYYGIKGVVEVGPGGAGTQDIEIPFRVTITTYMQFKNVR